MRIGRPPTALVFHFSRQFYTGYGEAKLRSFVDFPLEFNLHRYSYDHDTPDSADTSSASGSNSTSSSSSSSKSTDAGLLANWLYNLQAVVVHLGESGAGHFVTYRRFWQRSSRETSGDCLLHKSGYCWVKNDDACTTAIEEREVLAAQAYILLYEKAWSL